MRIIPEPLGIAFRRQLRRLSREDAGQSLVETAVSLSILMSFVFVFIEVCLAFYSYGLILELAREGTRYASVHGSTCLTASSVSCTASASTVNSYVTHLGYPNLAGGTMTVDTTFTSGSETPGSQVTVSITYTFPITVALVPHNAITLSTSSTASILQ
jgi:Flp pilus assembly protein TadG